MRFAPWLVGQRDALLLSLFSELATAVDRIEQKTSPSGRKAWWRRRVLSAREQTSRLSRDLLRYAAKASPLVRVAGALGVPLAEPASKALEAIESGAPPKPIEQMKEDVVRGLRKLQVPIVVIIDDLDRLEPREAAEITRLVRAVADFPNIIYVLCYVHRPLVVKDIAEFLGFDIQERLERIASSGAESDDIRSRAGNLLKALARGREYPR